MPQPDNDNGRADAATLAQMVEKIRSGNYELGQGFSTLLAALAELIKRPRF